MAATKAWNLQPDNTIVILNGGDYDDLCDLHFSLGFRDDFVCFYEPDLGNELTGFAIQPGSHPKWIHSLPLLSCREEVKTHE